MRLSTIDISISSAFCSLPNLNIWLASVPASLVCKFSSFGTKNSRLPGWQRKCEAIRTPFGVKSNKIKCENNKRGREGIEVMKRWDMCLLGVQYGRRWLRGWSRIYKPESGNPLFHRRRTRKTNAMATKCCTVCLAIRTRPHIGKLAGQQCQMSNNQSGW